MHLVQEKTSNFVFLKASNYFTNPGALGLIRVLQVHRYLLFAQAQCGLRVRLFCKYPSLWEGLLGAHPILEASPGQEAIIPPRLMSLFLLKWQVRSLILPWLFCVCLFDFRDRVFLWSPGWPIRLMIFSFTFDSWETSGCTDLSQLHSILPMPELESWFYI